MTHQPRRESSYGSLNSQITNARSADAEQNREIQTTESRLFSQHRNARSTLKAISNGFASLVINQKHARTLLRRLLRLRDKSEQPGLKESLPGQSDMLKRKRTDGSRDGTDVGGIETY
jgi:hypothetical protein